jgi:hypothetical protein
MEDIDTAIPVQDIREAEYGRTHAATAGNVYILLTKSEP